MKKNKKTKYTRSRQHKGMDLIFSENRSLLVIDNSRIRKLACSNVEKLIKKIDHLEETLLSFHKQDQQLFSSWFDLTFREDREEINTLQNEYIRLSRFHNWVVATARQLDISMPKAFRLMQNEEQAYNSGDLQTQNKIDELRKAREEYIQQQMRNEFTENLDEMGFGEDEDFEESGDESWEDPIEEMEATIEKIQSLSDKKITQICRDRDRAFELLSLSVSSGNSLKSFKLFLRIWKLCPHKVQVAFSKQFREETGQSLNVFIDEMRAAIAEIESLQDKHSKEDYSEDSSFRSKSTQNIDASDEETIKIVYRKLVRKLHPDMQRAENSDQTKQSQLSGWQQKIWSRAQTAYKERNRTLLEGLYKLTLLRFNKLNELTIGEIEESAQWLNEEYRNLEREASSVKQLPAWGFSSRKNHDSLIKKIRKDFKKALSEIGTDIEELRYQHVMFEAFSKENTKSRKSRGNEKKPRRRKKQRSEPNYGQQSFFE